MSFKNDISKLVPHTTEEWIELVEQEKAAAVRSFAEEVKKLIANQSSGDRLFGKLAMSVDQLLEEYERGKE